MIIKPEEVTSIIKGKLKEFENRIETVSSGTIIQIGDGIARVYGLDNCMEGELVQFSNGVYGMALNLEQDNAFSFIDLMKLFVIGKKTKGAYYYSKTNEMNRIKGLWYRYAVRSHSSRCSNYKQNDDSDL